MFSRSLFPSFCLWLTLAARHLCAYRGKDSVVELVLGAGCSLIQKDKQGRTPYDIAKKGNHKKVEDVLLRNAKKAILKGAQDGDHALVNGLLELYNIDVDYADVTGWTPLHYAAKGGRVGIVKLLFSHGCAMDLKNRAGKIALEVAEYGNDAVKTTLKKLMLEKEQKEKSQIMMAREEVDLLERKKEVQGSVDLRTRSSTAAPARAKNSSVKPELSIPAFDRNMDVKALKEEASSASEKDASGAEESASEDVPGTPTSDEVKAKAQPKEEGARLNEVLEQMKQAKAARQAKMAEQKKVLMASLSDEQKQALASRRESSPSSPKGVVLSPRLMMYDKEAMAEKEAREKKEKEEREAREAAEAAAKAEAEEQARIKEEEDALARQGDPFFQKVLAAEWTDLESMLDAFEVKYDEARSTRLLHLAQFELNDELELYKPREIEVSEEELKAAADGDAEEGDDEDSAGNGDKKTVDSTEEEHDDGEKEVPTAKVEEKAEVVEGNEAAEAPEATEDEEKSGGDALTTDGEAEEPAENAREVSGDAGKMAEEKEEPVDAGSEAPQTERDESPKQNEGEDAAPATEDVFAPDTTDGEAKEDSTDAPPTAEKESLEVQPSEATSLTDASSKAEETTPPAEVESSTAEMAPSQSSPAQSSPREEETAATDAPAKEPSHAAAVVADTPVATPAQDVTPLADVSIDTPVVAAPAQDVVPLDDVSSHAPVASADTLVEEADAATAAEKEDDELQRLLTKYGQEDAGDEEITDDLLDHFDDLLAGLDASAAGLVLDSELQASMEAS